MDRRKVIQDRTISKTNLVYGSSSSLALAAESNSEESFKEAFQNFAAFSRSKTGGLNQDSSERSIDFKIIDKWLAQANVLDGKNVTIADTVISFSKISTEPNKCLNEEEFENFIEQLASDTGQNADEIKRKLQQAKYPSSQNSKIPTILDVVTKSSDSAPLKRKSRSAEGKLEQQSSIEVHRASTANMDTINQRKTENKIHKDKRNAEFKKTDDLVGRKGKSSDDTTTIFRKVSLIFDAVDFSTSTRPRRSSLRLTSKSMSNLSDVKTNDTSSQAKSSRD